MTVLYSEDAKKQLKKISKADKNIVTQIRKYLEKLSTLADPKSRGKELKGNLANFWRYRVGNYRIICDINNEKMIIMVIRIGNRKDVYEL